jgi:hypothetical protein
MSKGYVFGAAGLLAVAGIALLAGRCGGSAEPTAREPQTENEPSAAEQRAGTDSTTNTPASALTSSATAARQGDAPVVTDAAAPTSSAESVAAPASSAATRINAALGRDPKDLALFARIERELKRAPPPAVATIVELRTNGATRDELLAQTRRLLADDFQVRTLVVRWIDEVAPAPGSAKPAPATPGSSPSGPAVVQPIRTK